MIAPGPIGLSLLVAKTAAHQYQTSLVIARPGPAGDFRHRAVTAQTYILVIEAAIADAGRRHRCDCTSVVFSHRHSRRAAVHRLMFRQHLTHPAPGIGGIIAAIRTAVKIETVIRTGIHHQFHG